ncbi:hypothetical protein UMZ34_11915 [Halopseudomonas pachastrellae]|nr:hypothetical protein UMZ34_11915 [Halopseudomonas pachastrellae]
MFLQLWDNPLYTVAGDQLLSDALSLCGADNVFADLTGLAPQVGREGVLVANPDTIIAWPTPASPPSAGSTNGAASRNWPRLNSNVCTCWTATCWCARRRRLLRGWGGCVSW